MVLHTAQNLRMHLLQSSLDALLFCRVMVLLRQSSQVAELFEVENLFNPQTSQMFVVLVLYPGGQSRNKGHFENESELSLYILQEHQTYWTFANISQFSY